MIRSQPSPSLAASGPRHGLIALSIAATLLLSLCGQSPLAQALAESTSTASPPLAATPNTGLGPFYPVTGSREMDPDLTRLEGQEAPPQGQILRLRTQVLSTTGEAVENAQVVLWQTDVWGKYDHPREDRSDAEGEPLPLDPGFQYFGQTSTDAAGDFEVLTIVPGAYSGRPGHIHLSIRAPGYRPLATEIQFAGDPAADGDFVTSAEQRPALTTELKPDPQQQGRLLALHQIVLTPAAP